MKMRYNNINANDNSQQGAVLIVVLLFLVLITLAGVMSVKNSNTDLRVATSDQINTVLLQSAENVNSKLESSVNSSQKSKAYKKLMVDKTGVFSHYVNDYSILSAKDTIAFCFEPRSDKNFNIKNSVVNRGTGILSGSKEKGYCDPTIADNYTSNRSTTMTQVMINKTDFKDAYKKAFADAVEGSDTKTTGVKKVQFDIHSTAVLPSFGSADSDDVKGCMQKAAALKTDNQTIDRKAMLDCMSSNDIIAKQVVERVEIGKKVITEYCTLYGGAEGSSSSKLCK